MRTPLLRYLAPLAIVALCAAAPAAPLTTTNDIGGLDLPVPASAGAWSVTLRAPATIGTRAYALDSLGTAIEARIANYPLDQRTVTAVGLSPEAIASIERAVASANAAAWHRESSYQVAPVAMFGLDTLGPLVPNPTTQSDFASTRSMLTLTLAWRAPDGTIRHGQASWNAALGNAEPSDAIALAHTIGSAFGLLI